MTRLQSDLKDNPKRFWLLFVAKPESERLPKMVYFGSEKASSPATKANFFSKSFASVFKKPNLHTPTADTSASITA